MDRRRFLQAAALGATPTVLGAGIGTVAAHAGEGGGSGKHTAARSAPGLGVQRIIWSGAGSDGVALTFDDGPDDDLTPRVLDVLDRYRVPATFLLVGWRAAARPDLVRRAVDAGHELGNHTWSHPSLATIQTDQVREEIGRTAETLASIAPGSPVRWFRPPRGILTGAGAQVAGEHGCDVLLWSCTRGPARATDPAAVGSYVVRHLEPGTIVCLHDGTGRSEMGRWPRWGAGMRRKREIEIAALPGIIERALDAGVRFVTVSDLVR